MSGPVTHRGCTAECYYSTGPVSACTCACGGENHGKGAHDDPQSTGVVSAGGHAFVPVTGWDAEPPSAPPDEDERLAARLTDSQRDVLAWLWIDSAWAQITSDRRQRRAARALVKLGLARPHGKGWVLTEAGTRLALRQERVRQVLAIRNNRLGDIPPGMLTIPRRRP